MTPHQELYYLRKRNLELRLMIEAMDAERKHLAESAGNWRAIATGWQQVAIAAQEKARILEEQRNV